MQTIAGESFFAAFKSQSNTGGSHSTDVDLEHKMSSASSLSILRIQKSRRSKCARFKCNWSGTAKCILRVEAQLELGRKNRERIGLSRPLSLSLSISPSLSFSFSLSLLLIGEVVRRCR